MCHLCTHFSDGLHSAGLWLDDLRCLLQPKLLHDCTILTLWQSPTNIWTFSPAEFPAISFALWTHALLKLNYRFSTVYFPIALSETESCPWPSPSVSVTPREFLPTTTSTLLSMTPKSPSHFLTLLTYTSGWFTASLTKQNWAGSVASWYLSSFFFSYHQ